MEPIAIVTAFVAALYIVCRGPFVVAPAATAAFYRRLFSTAGRVRIFGGLLVLLAAALIGTARQAHAAHGDITFLIEGLGWMAAAAAVWLIVAPGTWWRLADKFFSASNPSLRTIGVLNIAIGVGLGWVAFFVL